MSDRRPGAARRTLLLSGALLLMVAPRMEGQEPTGRDRDAHRAALEARAAELETRWRAAEARARVAEAMAQEASRMEPRVALDTLGFGTVHVVTPASQRARTEALWSEVWQLYAPLVPQESRLHGRFFGFQWGSRHDLGLPVGTPSLRVGTPWAPVRRARQVVQRALGGVLVRDLPGGMAAWSGMRALEPPDFSEIHRGLALSSRSVARACFQGDLDACWTAAGARGREGLLAALEPAEARALVHGRNTVSSLPWRRCLEAGDHGACVEVLRADAPLLDLLALDAATRTSLLWVAIERGGAGAVERAGVAGAAPPGPGERVLDIGGFDLRAGLEAVASENADSVVAAWHARVRAAAPDVPRQTRRAHTLALFWAAAFALLATRSTRWRFG